MKRDMKQGSHQGASSLGLRRLAVFGLVSLMSACSVQTASVPAKPPLLGGPDVIVAQRDIGTLRMESASVFFWPVSDDAAVNRQTVSTVGRLSNEIDGLQRAMSSLQAKVEADLVDWKRVDCPGRFAIVPDGQSTTDLEEISEWRDVQSADSQTQKLHADCQDNQARRQAARPEQDRLREEQRTRVELIYTTIDKGYPEVVENLIPINSRGSQIRLLDRELRPGVRAAEVVLRDFVHERHRRQDLQAELRTTSQSLVFSIPEWSVDQTPTGRTFQFELGRNSDFLGFARWTGDVRLVDQDGRVVRVGSVKLEGTMN
jgi:hypothetical protein